jgi:hypothetical protein
VLGGDGLQRRADDVVAESLGVGDEPFFFERVDAGDRVRARERWPEYVSPPGYARSLNVSAIAREITTPPRGT